MLSKRQLRQLCQNFSEVLMHGLLYNYRSYIVILKSMPDAKTTQKKPEPHSSMNIVRKNVKVWYLSHTLSSIKWTQHFEFLDKTRWKINKIMQWQQVTRKVKGFFEIISVNTNFTVGCFFQFVYWVCDPREWIYRWDGRWRASWIEEEQ